MKARVPGMTKGGGNMNAMLKQVQTMQADMANLQQDLDEREYTATSGGGIIEVTVNGKHEIKALKIDPEAVDPDDIEMLEDLITVAVNEAINNAIKTAESEMGEITSGLNIPGMPGMF
jgi:DNA-binding YbaB/EbfC family protein